MRRQPCSAGSGAWRGFLLRLKVARHCIAIVPETGERGKQQRQKWLSADGVSDPIDEVPKPIRSRAAKREQQIGPRRGSALRTVLARRNAARLLCLTHFLAF